MKDASTYHGDTMRMGKGCARGGCCDGRARGDFEKFENLEIFVFKFLGVVDFALSFPVTETPPRQHNSEHPMG